MIHAYNEMYLDTVTKNLAGMFDIALNAIKIDTDYFAKKFADSRVAAGMENGNPNMLAGKSSSELLSIVLDKNISACIVSMDRSPEYWAGWVLARAQWELNLPFVRILDAVPMSLLISMYYPLHEAGESKAVDEIRKRLPKPVSRLKELRKSEKLTQEQLAILSGVNIRSIRSYEQNSNDLSKAQGETLLSLARVLNCSIEELIL